MPADVKKQIDALSAEFDRWMEARIDVVSGSELTPEKREKRRAKADRDPLFWAKTYFPQIFRLPWNAMHHWIAERPWGRWTLDGHPESGKSALCYVLYVVRPLVMGEGGIINNNAYKLEDAERRVWGVSELIRNNRLLNYDYPIKFQRDAMTHLKINDTELIPGSVRTGLRHLTTAQFERVRYQINDDLYNRVSVRSQTLIDECMDFITGEAWRQLSGNIPHLSITLGNTITERSPIVRLAEMYPDNHFSFPALDERGESNWPQFRSAKEWDEYSRSIPYHVWLGEYMAKPAPQGDTFKPDWIRHTPPLANMTMTARIACHDTARGESPAACDKAVITGSLWVDETGAREVVVVEDIYLRPDPYPLLFDYMSALRDRLPYSVLQVENDFAQWDFAQPYYNQWVAAIGTRLPLPIDFFLAKDMATEFLSAKKEDRIMSLVHPVQTGILVFDEAALKTKDGERFLVQYNGWRPGAKTLVDGLDAMASFYILIRRYAATGSFKPSRARSIEKPRWFRFF